MALRAHCARGQLALLSRHLHGECLQLTGEAEESVLQPGGAREEAIDIVLGQEDLLK
jgi:hypothetical protein